MAARIGPDAGVIVNDDSGLPSRGSTRSRSLGRLRDAREARELPGGDLAALRE
jgi:hypothetical protein